MTIQEILLLPTSAMSKYGKALAAEYKRLYNKDVCLSCSGDVRKMILKLKKNYTIMNYELAKPSVIYRVRKGEPLTISNNTMTDELAQEFLAVNPERIKLFSRYPENWKELIGLEEKSELEYDCKECLEAQLKDLKVKEIESYFPEIPYKGGTKKADYIQEIIDSLNFD